MKYFLIIKRPFLFYCSTVLNFNFLCELAILYEFLLFYIFIFFIYLYLFLYFLLLLLFMNLKKIYLFIYFLYYFLLYVYLQKWKETFFSINN